MKKYSTQILLGLVLAVLMATYIFIKLDSPIEDMEKVFVLDKNEEINHIAIDNQYGNLEMELDEGKWRMIKPEKDLVSKEKAKMMVEILANLQINRVMEERLPEYGLDSPYMTIEFNTDKDESYRIDIGNETISKTKYYAANNGDYTYLIDSGFIAQFDASAAAFRNREIFSVDTEDIVEIQCMRKGETAVTLLQDDDKWRLSSPFQAGAREIEIKEFLAKFRRLTIAGYFDNDKAMEGFEENQAETLVVTDGKGNRQKFEFGISQDPFRLVKTNGLYYKVYDIDVDLDVLNPSDLLFEAPLKESIDKIKTIKIRIDKEDHTYEIEKEDGDYRFQVNGSHISSEDFTSIFVKYISILADGYEPFETSGEPYAEMTTVFNDGSSKRLALYQRSDGDFNMSFDKTNKYYLKKDRLENLEYWMEKAEQ